MLSAYIILILTKFLVITSLSLAQTFVLLTVAGCRASSGAIHGKENDSLKEMAHVSEGDGESRLETNGSR